METVKKNGGKVPATHRHPSYGVCVILSRIGFQVIIQTNFGSAIVPSSSIRPIKGE